MYPWDLQQNVPLASYTTLEVGGRAQYFVAVTDLGWLPELIRWAHTKRLPIGILGGGSNLVVSDQGFAGLVLHLASAAGPNAFSLHPDGDTLRVQVAAQMPWDALVAATCAAGAYGLACLSGIPGACGAAPVQNIGAYGQSLSDTLVGVEGLCLRTGETHRWRAAELGLGYRTSLFKTAWQGRYIITQLCFELPVGPMPFVSAYPQLTEALAAQPVGALEGPAAVRQCVLQLRSHKSMVWVKDDVNRRSVGSFFTNPIVRTSHAQALCQAYAAMPTWPQGAYTKLSAAWLIEQAGFAKGFQHGAVGLSSRHCLALINRGHAKAQDVIELAHVMQSSVRAQFGVGLAPEPSFWGFGASHPLPAPAHNDAWAPVAGVL